MNYKQYLAESERTYNYRIKTVVTLEKEHMVKIEQYLKRFNLLNISPIIKTILHKQPLDFGPAIQNAEVRIIDFELSLPLSPFVAENELTSILSIPSGYLLVRGEYDALEVQTDALQQQSAIAQQALEKGLEASPLMSTVSTYPQAEQTASSSNYYGDAYNNKLIGLLKQIASERTEEQKVEPSDPLFSWLDLKKIKPTPDDDQAFNKGHTSLDKIDTKDAMVPTDAGNFSDAGKIVKKTFTASNGKTKTLSAKSTSIARNEK